MSRRALPWAQALARQGHTVTLLAPPWDWPADAGRRAWVGGVEIVQVRVDGGPLAILIRLLLAIWQRRPTVLVACKPKGYSGLVLWCLWWWRRLGGWRGQLWLDMDDWETGWNERLAYPRPLARFFAWQEPWCLAHADRVTAASRWLTAYATAARRQSPRSPDCRTRSASAPAQSDRRTCSAPAPIVHLPNGMDRAALTGDLTVAPHGPPTALLYTRFVEVTPARIVRVWAQVVRQAPSARLIVIGDATPVGRFAAAPNGPGIEASAGLPQGSQVPNNRLKPPFQMSSATTFGILVGA
ncbi:MAG: glycosyltransferase [Anaerolineae bacterium]